MPRRVLREGLTSDIRGLWRTQPVSCCNSKGQGFGDQAQRIHLGVIPEMFQPLPVRLNHALDADTVHAGDSRMGTLQEVELLTGEEKES